MDMTLHLQTVPSQILSSRQIQSLNILEMGLQELHDYINDFALENPVFDVQEKPETFSNDSLHSKPEDVSSSFDPLQNIAQTDCKTLYDELIGQVQALKIERSLLSAACFIIESLDERGYLMESEHEFAAALGLPVQEIKMALKIVQSLEPAGIGARTLSECLCLQLQRLPGNTKLTQTIAKNYLTQLAAHQYAQIARALLCSPIVVQQGAELIRSLNPKPGLLFSGQQTLQYVYPDLIVTKSGENFELSVSDRDFPHIHINDYYATLLRTTQDKDVRTYLESKLNSARRLISCVAQRRNTLIRCAEILVDFQRKFFHRGPSALAPLSLSLIAQKMDVHVSTVSRTIKHKYIQCDFGVYPLSYFFVRKVTGTPNLSGDKVRHLIEEVIAQEDHSKPCSDREIAEYLSHNGIGISRRTVAKYRSELHILGAAQRRIPSVLA